MNNSITIYSLLSFLLLFSCAKISYKIKFLDLPSKRKNHSTATAYTGGIAISTALVSSILLLNISNDIFKLILSIAFLISIVGLIDDKFNLSVINKLSLQIIPILYLTISQNLILNELGDYNYFQLQLGIFGIPFTLICVLFLINAFNYFDGIDGTLGFSSISVLSILYFLIPNHELQFFLLTVFIPISVFLCFNFSLFKLPKIFLGDSGSLLIGFIISFILIYIANHNLIHPILLAWSIVIFVYEFLSINLIRLKNKKNLFSAGQDHLHHILFRNSNSVFITNSAISSINIILFIIGYLSFSLVSPMASLILFISFFIIFFIFRKKY